MRHISTLATLFLTLALAACSGTETRPADTADFAAGNYRYFKWRSEPLQNTANSSADLYVLDPMIRSSVNAALKDKGFVLDEERAQFSIDYFFAAGMREGEKSQAASNITPYPTVLPNRLPDGATVDNAYALGGVKKTANIALQFNDVARQQEVWHVIITKIMEDANMNDKARLQRNTDQAIRQGLRDLPAAR